MKLNKQIVLATLFSIAFGVNPGALEGEQSIDKVSTSVTTTSRVKSKQTAPKSSTTKLETSIISTKSSIEKSSYSSDLVETKNVVSYAADPLTTVTTTDEQGRTVTKPLWWLPSTTQISQETGSSISTSNDGPVAVVTTTNTAGETHLSTIWWTPTTTYDDASTTVSDGSEIATTLISTILTTSKGKVSTIISKHISTAIGKIASVSSALNSTVSVHTNAGKNLEVHYGLGALAMAIVHLL